MDFLRYYLRYWRSQWLMLVFLLGYVALLIVVSRLYLLPALAVWREASEVERRWLSATSALLLAVVLFMLAVGILLVFRIRRYFLPPPDKQTKTTYIDAWAESARRLQHDIRADRDEE
jgi:hypothetical protein